MRLGSDLSDSHISKGRVDSHVVVDSGKSAIGSSHLASGLGESLEGLRRSDLMDDVPVADAGIIPGLAHAYSWVDTLIASRHSPVASPAPRRVIAHWGCFHHHRFSGILLLAGSSSTATARARVRCLASHTVPRAVVGRLRWIAHRRQESSSSPIDVHDRRAVLAHVDDMVVEHLHMRNDDRQHATSGSRRTRYESGTHFVVKSSWGSLFVVWQRKPYVSYGSRYTEQRGSSR